VRELGGADGFYALQAAIIACHAEAPTAASNRLVAHIRNFTRSWRRWRRSPIIELNRAVAIGMAEGPAKRRS